MKTALPLLLRLLLTVCLAVYGPIAMAATNTGGASFSMEICADGVARTVRVDADGVPVEHHQECQDCLICCEATGAHPNVVTEAGLHILTLDVALERTPYQTPSFLKRTIRPMPRAPPVMHFSVLSQLNLINRDQSLMGHHKSSDGRSFFKDATA